VAPGGIEPPHVDSKSTALSTELRGRDRKRSPSPIVAVVVAYLVTLRPAAYVEARRVDEASDAPPDEPAAAPAPG
jgi:hypothetical protein